MEQGKPLARPEVKDTRLSDGVMGICHICKAPTDKYKMGFIGQIRYYLCNEHHYMEPVFDFSSKTGIAGGHMHLADPAKLEEGIVKDEDSL